MSFSEDKDSLFALSGNDSYSSSRKQLLMDFSNPDSYDWNLLIVTYYLF
jgi:hypothetical protein